VSELKQAVALSLMKHYPLLCFVFGIENDKGRYRAWYLNPEFLVQHRPSFSTACFHGVRRALVWTLLDQGGELVSAGLFQPHLRQQSVAMPAQILVALPADALDGLLQIATCAAQGRYTPSSAIAKFTVTRTTRMLRFMLPLLLSRAAGPARRKPVRYRKPSPVG
jgi:hypothetical protein